MKVLIAIACCMLLSSCGDSGPTPPPANSDQSVYYERWANKNATDAQIDALRNEMPRPVDSWQAKVSNVTETKEFTIIETNYQRHTYKLWVFEAEARVKARQIYANTDVTFSGDLVQEVSLTREGARKNPEIGVYVSRVIGGGLDIIQTKEGIAHQHELDRKNEAKVLAEREAKNRDSSYEGKTIDICKEAVIKRLKFPSDGDFSWFQARVNKESDTSWVYTDEVTTISASGKEISKRFVCTVKFRTSSIDTRVKFLN